MMLFEDIVLQVIRIERQLERPVRADNGVQKKSRMDKNT